MSILSRVACVLFVLVGAATPALAEAETSESLIVGTSTGTFAGDRIGQVNRFLGIPFAAPPVGTLRWKAPKTPAPQRGVQSAHNFKSPCVQVGGIFGSSDPRTFGQNLGSEDCLYLNVWAPVDAHNRPVVLFIHGGANVFGTGALNIYDGTRFAQEANAVYITTNYRLGFFGGMHLPALADYNPLDDSGDYGLLDIIQALKWVQQNAAAIGGDSSNVTVVGQSAGCINVYSLLESPVATGTFQKAICMSGLQAHSSVDDATKNATGLVANLLLADGLIGNYNDASAYIQRVGNQAIQTYLSKKTSAEILTATARPIPGTLGIGTTSLSVSLNIADGTVIPVPPAVGEPPIINKVPTILSTVKNESGLLLFFGYTAAGFTQQQFWAYDQSNNPNLQASDFMPLVPNQVEFDAVTTAADPALGVVVDGYAANLATTMPVVYRSEFDWASYPSPWVDFFHSFHGLDICFNFDTFPVGEPNLVNFVTPSSSRQVLGQKMLSAIRGFIETGNPNTYLGQYNLYWQPWERSPVRFIWQ
jgi:para-nitrobenzyl esterase